MTRFHMYAQASKHPHEADDIFIEKPNSGEQVIWATFIQRYFEKLVVLLNSDAYLTLKFLQKWKHQNSLNESWVQTTRN